MCCLRVVQFSRKKLTAGFTGQGFALGPSVQKLLCHGAQTYDFRWAGTLPPGTRDEHLQVSFLALAREGPKHPKPIPRVAIVPNSGRKRAKRKTAPVPCARKRETDTEQTGKQRPGRNYLNLTFQRKTTLSHGKGRSLALQHAHRTAAAVAQICLEQGNQGTRSPNEAKEFQDQTDS